MREESLFQAMHRLAEQLKGGPVTSSEKQGMEEAFYRAGGSAFERATAALSETLNTNPSILFERTEALDEGERLLAHLRHAAEAWKGTVER